MKNGPRSVLTRPAHEVAPLLIGWTIRVVSEEGTVALRITETEAYEGQTDPASHAYRGLTPRSSTMFGEAGHLYVYRSHGLHWCMNVVTGDVGQAHGVLLRAGRVIEGVDVVRARRGAHVASDSLARGPGCFAQALGVTGADKGADVIDGPHIRLEQAINSAHLANGPRVGVSRAADVPWRWWNEGETSVSAYRRSPRATIE